MAKRYTFSLDYSVEASSVKEATKLIKENIVADAELNLSEAGIDTWLGELLEFSHISDELN